MKEKTADSSVSMAQKEWNQLTYKEKVVCVWSEQGKYALGMCERKEDAEDILQDAAEIFLNVERVEVVFVQNTAKIIFKQSILDLQENENNKDIFVGTFRKCLRNLAKKALREIKNKKVSIYELQKIFKDYAHNIENYDANEVNNYFLSLIKKYKRIEPCIFFLIDKKNGYDKSEIAQMYKTSVYAVQKGIDRIINILEDFRNKENLKIE